jgi:hypothetical protein
MSLADLVTGIVIGAFAAGVGFAALIWRSAGWWRQR